MHQRLVEAEAEAQVQHLQQEQTELKTKDLKAETQGTQQVLLAQVAVVVRVQSVETQQQHQTTMPTLVTAVQVGLFQ
jgi:hypothetical protein